MVTADETACDFKVKSSGCKENLIEILSKTMKNWESFSKN